MTPRTVQDCDATEQYKSALTSSFRVHLGKDKISHGLTLETLASALSMSPRSVAELTAGRNGPSGLTLALYLVYLCDDTGSFLADLKGAFDKVRIWRGETLSESEKECLEYCAEVFK